ncbi:MAG: DUF4012 domain-containing protein [Parcubacteria group bacterium]|jgi:hypothetical protein
MEDQSHSGKDRNIIKIIKRYLTLKITLAIILAVAITGTAFLFLYAKNHKGMIGVKALSAISSISKFLPIPQDEQKEIDVLNELVGEFSKNDDKERVFLVLLQNNMELRPGGGFLGQYAVIKIKNREVTSTFLEDANLLDRRITAKVAPPYPLKRMMQIKRWKFRDSNFSPDFPANAEKAKYFLGLGGQAGKFDGVIAVNAQVFNDILAITGPVSVPGYSQTFTGSDGALKLEELVEKQYIIDPELDTENRKMIMKKMAPIIISKLTALNNIPKIANFVHSEFKNRNIMVNFEDSNLQSLAESVHWDGSVADDWGSDYLMTVDANMGSLKTDYYIKREISYDVDFTAQKPIVTLHILYKNTASQADWRTSDYHTYLRVYAPEGSNLLEKKMASSLTDGNEFGKKYFGFIVHATIANQTDVMIKYELPEQLNNADYRLLIQKQSGAGDVPVKVHLKTENGEFNQEQTLSSDLKFQFEN